MEKTRSCQRTFDLINICELASSKDHKKSSLCLSKFTKSISSAGILCKYMYFRKTGKPKKLLQIKVQIVCTQSITIIAGIKDYF